VFGSLDYIYLPVADVDGEALRYVQILGAELVWKVRGMGTTVACLRAGEQGPAILLSGHLQGPGAILVYRVQDYAATVAQLRAWAWDTCVAHKSYVAVSWLGGRRRLPWPRAHRSGSATLPGLAWRHVPLAKE
jgi:hypothetical protein